MVQSYIMNKFNKLESERRNMKIYFGQYYLEIDIHKTKAFYKKLENISEGCNCPGCRNFEKAVEVLPDEIKNFFNSIGIDMKKPAEVYVNTVNADGLLLYGGFFHLCGRILNGESAWVKNDGNENAIVSYWEHSKTYSVSKNFFVSFQEECSLIEDGFPTPVLQMEIEANIPWILEETNIYI